MNKDNIWVNPKVLTSFGHEKLKPLGLEYRARANIIRLYVALCIRYVRHGFDGNATINTNKTRWAIRQDCESVKASDNFKGNVGGKPFYNRIKLMKDAGLVNAFESTEPISFNLPPNAVEEKTEQDIADIRKAAGKKKLAKLTRQAHRTVTQSDSVNIQSDVDIDIDEALARCKE